MRFEVLVVVTMKISAFWAMTLCTVVRIYWLLEEPSVFTLTVEQFFYSENGRTSCRQNIRIFLPEYTVSHEETQLSL
jgi:hypothetical protein